MFFSNVHLLTFNLWERLYIDPFDNSKERCKMDETACIICMNIYVYLNHKRIINQYVEIIIASETVWVIKVGRTYTILFTLKDSLWENSLKMSTVSGTVLYLYASKIAGFFCSIVIMFTYSIYTRSEQKKN